MLACFGGGAAGGQGGGYLVSGREVHWNEKWPMFFWGKISHCGNPKRTHCELYKRKKLLYLEKINHIYLDNEILLVAKTRQNYKKIIFDCSRIGLIFLVDDRQSIYSIILKKTPWNWKITLTCLNVEELKNMWGTKHRKVFPSGSHQPWGLFKICTY
jgi:hypothetical protein